LVLLKLFLIFFWEFSYSSSNTISKSST
jgi:hypothetical protein